MATHFPIRKGIEVSMEPVITLKAVHMRHLNVSICVPRAHMVLSESPTRTCLFCGCSNAASSADLLAIQTAVVDGVLRLRSYSVFGFNCKWMMIYTFAVMCFATTGCLYSTGCLAYTQEVSNQPLQWCLCLNLAWSSYVLTCRLYPRYSVSGFCYRSLCYKQLPLLCVMSRTELKGVRGR